MNAANEVAVAAFLDEKIGFMDIPCMIETVLSAASIEQVESIAQLVAVDAMTRQQASDWLSVHA